MDAEDVARALRDIAILLRVRGENPYRARAYERGADAVETLGGDLAARVKEGTLTDVPGIGEALAKQIVDILGTGRSTLLEKLRADLPPGILELAEVPGLTVARIRTLHDALGIASAKDLLEACRSHRVRAVRGFGPKTEAKLLEALTTEKRRDDRIRLVDAIEEATPIRDRLRATKGVSDAVIAGGVRRWKEIVRRIVLVAAADDPKVAVDAFVRDPRLVRTIERTEDAATCTLATGTRVVLHATEPRRFGVVLHRRTGSPKHVRELRDAARDRGLELDEGTLRARGRELDVPTEGDLFRTLAIEPIPPELREGRGEVELASRGELPEVVSLSDVRGLVHCHTTWSDGTATVEEMARAADALGMEYLTITDHSSAAHYARGLDVDRLKAQWDEIARVQELVRVRLLRGTEADILADGAIDWPDAILERLDVVVASVHSRFKMDEAAMTERIVRAMEHPTFKIWGHALGRLLLRRDPFEVRMDEVLDAIASSRAAIEINGDPYRLDMAPRWIREAKTRGIRFVVSVDAHSTDALGNFPFGVAMARRGGLVKRDVLNTLGAADFARVVRPAA